MKLKKKPCCAKITACSRFEGIGCKQATRAFLLFFTYLHTNLFIYEASFNSLETLIHFKQNTSMQNEFLTEDQIKDLRLFMESIIEDELDEDNLEEMAEEFDLQ